MQATILHLDTLRSQGKPISFYWIPSYKDIKENKAVDIAAKEAKRWKSAKKKNGKWKEWDSGYTSEEKKLGRLQATVKLALERKASE